MKLVICDTDIDRYAYISETNETKASFEIEYHLNNDSIPELLNDLAYSLKNHKMDFQDIEDLDAWFITK